MTDQRHRLLAEQAAQQYGVFTRRDLRKAGFPDNAATRGVASGRYRQLLPGVYSIAGSPPSLLQKMAASILSMPSLAALSHRTAAELWGLTDRGIGCIDIVTQRWDRVRRSDVQIHESLDLIEADVTTVNGLPATNAARTVVDLGAVRPWDVERALEAGIRKGFFTLTEVEALVARVARRGRRGVGVLRPLLAERRQWDHITESALEDLFLKKVIELNLPQPQCQYLIRDDAGILVCRADFAYPQSRVLIELDSEAHHMDRLAFRRDRSKQNKATVLGWVVLRYTWWDLRAEPYRVAAEVRAALGGGRYP